MANIEWERPGVGDAAIKMRSEQGLSPNVIAARIGHIIGRSVSRNAVIGYLSRRGVTGPERTHVARSGSAPRRRRDIQATRKPTPVRQSGNPKVRALFQKEPGLATDNTAQSDIENPSPDRQTILVRRSGDGAIAANDRLTDDCCRWPVGDPYQPDFHFCGRTVVPGLPYCENHGRRAYRQSVTIAAAAEQKKVLINA